MNLDESKFKRAIFLLVTCLHSGLLFCNCSSHKNEFFIGTGVVENAFTKVSITQEGHPRTTFTNKFLTKPFVSPPYYLVRYIRWLSQGFALGGEFIHQKLYLEEKPDYVQRFDITNGFNLIYFDQLFALCQNNFSELSFLLGEGIVLTHPETTIRWQKFSERGGIRLHDTDGYFVSGVTLQTALKAGVYPFEWLGINVEGKGTYSFATIPIANGTANVWNIACHLVGSISLRF